jgi:DNA-binding PadR family transcriptional regulator
MKKVRRSSLGLIVLALLGEEPMHVYRMQQLIQQRGKARVVNIRERASLYQTIERLQRLGLIAIHATVRGDRHPDRIVYTITVQGQETAREWLRETLRTTGAEYPDFPAGISVLTMLTPDDACAQLEVRTEAVRAALAEVEAQLRDNGQLPRLFLLEEDYQRALLVAECAWLDTVIADLRARRLCWDDRWLREAATAFNSHEEDEPASGG